MEHYRSTVPTSAFAKPRSTVALRMPRALPPPETEFAPQPEGDRRGPYSEQRNARKVPDPKNTRFARYFRDNLGGERSELDELDEEIRNLYTTLRYYGRSADADPVAETKFQATLARLRALQRREADLLLGERDRHSDWRPGEGREAIEEAKRLLEVSAHLATPNDSTNDSDP